MLPEFKVSSKFRLSLKLKVPPELEAILEVALLWGLEFPFNPDVYNFYKPECSPLFRYNGSKARLFPKLAPLILSSCKYDGTFIDVCGGTGFISMNINSCKNRYINDIDPELALVYHVLSVPAFADNVIDRVIETIEELCNNNEADVKCKYEGYETHLRSSEIRHWFLNNEEFLEHIENLDKEEVRLECAYNIIMYKLLSYRGSKDGSPYLSKSALMEINRRLRRCEEYYKRALNGVNVCCKPADDLIKSLHSQGILNNAVVYIDPPYLEASKNKQLKFERATDVACIDSVFENIKKNSDTYQNNYTIFDMIALLGVVDSYCIAPQTKVILSNYNNKIIETYLTRSRHTWYRYKLADLRVQSSKTNSKSKYAEEYIYTNFKIE